MTTPEELERKKREIVAARMGAAAEHEPPAQPDPIARRAAMISMLAFVGLGGAGFGALATIGVVVPRSWLINAAFIVAGAGCAAFNSYVFQRPTAFRFAASDGSDAFGMHRWGPSHQGTRTQGRRFGAIGMAVGVGLLVLGVIFGALTTGY